MTKLSNAALAERAKAVFTPNYRPAPLVLEQGEGAWVVDIEGNRFLDMVSGVAVSVLGHNHPKVVEALRDQAGAILHTSNLYLNRPSIDLAEALVANSFGDGVFFCNSGAEANEAALKLARRYAYDRGDKDRARVVTFERSFHGRTYGALAATGQPKYQEGFGPMPGGFTTIAYGDMEALAAAVDGSTAAVLVEPIQGEGGVRVPPPGFLAACRRICDEHGALLIFDEVQTGVGRTGTLFAYEQEGVHPDIMCLAKGLGAGLPLGAIVATHQVGASLTYGTHATTFGGNPMACRAGKAVLEVLTEPGFLGQVAAKGDRLRRGLAPLEVFSEVRGRGLLVGAELREDCSFDARDVVSGCRARGVLVHIAGPRVVRMVPPLTLSDHDVDVALGAVRQTVEALLAVG